MDRVIYTSSNRDTMWVPSTRARKDQKLEGPDHVDLYYHGDLDKYVEYHKLPERYKHIPEMNPWSIEVLGGTWKR